MGAVHIESAVLRTAAVIAGIVLAAAVIAGTAAVIPIVIMTGAIPICSAMVLLAAAAAIIMVIMGSACSIMLSALTILLIHAAAVLTVPIVRATADCGLPCGGLPAAGLSEQAALDEQEQPWEQLVPSAGQKIAEAPEPFAGLWVHFPCGPFP